MIDYQYDEGMSGAEREATLERLMAFVNRQLELELAVVQIKETLKEAEKEYNKISLLEIPEIMDSLGVEEITLKNGRKVSVKENLYCSVPKKNMELIAKILTDNGYETLLKTDVIIPLDATDRELKSEVFRVLESSGVDFQEKFGVNTASLKKAIKEMLAEGVDISLDTFGAFIKKEAKIK